MCRYRTLRFKFEKCKSGRSHHCNSKKELDRKPCGNKGVCLTRDHDEVDTPGILLGECPDEPTDPFNVWLLAQVDNDIGVERLEADCKNYDKNMDDVLQDLADGKYRTKQIQELLAARQKEGQ